jgi:hypothetical protein
MSRKHNTIVRAGEILVKKTRQGVQFHAYNHEHNKFLCIGSVIGQVFEKVAPILRLPEPSICVSESEFAAALEAGALYLCVLPRGGGTYGISLADFRKHAKPYYNPSYGPQYRCSLEFFEYSFETRKRNPHLDNPTTERAEMVLPRQLSMF